MDVAAGGGKELTGPDLDRACFGRDYDQGGFAPCPFSDS
jgi:hypothetical protein